MATEFFKIGILFKSFLSRRCDLKMTFLVLLVPNVLKSFIFALNVKMQ